MHFKTKTPEDNQDTMLDLSDGDDEFDDVRSLTKADLNTQSLDTVSTEDDPDASNLDESLVEQDKEATTLEAVDS